MKRTKRKQRIISVRLDEQLLKQLDAFVAAYNAKGSNANRGHLMRLALQRFLQANGAV